MADIFIKIGIVLTIIFTIPILLLYGLMKCR